MYGVLMRGVTRLLTTPDEATGRPPPFAVMADKATVMRKTGQMHGIILMIEGAFVALFVSVLLAGDIGDGQGLASLLVQMLMQGAPFSLSAEHLRSSLTGLAFDGQSRLSLVKACFDEAAAEQR